MTEERLRELEDRGWRITRDGSTATASFVWEDPDDEDSGWEMLVLHTAGHTTRFVLTPDGSGLYERSADDARRLHATLSDALILMAEWQGEIPSED